MQGNLTYKIPGEEERNMVNGKQKQNKHKRLNKKIKKEEVAVAQMEKQAQLWDSQKRNTAILKANILQKNMYGQNQTKPPHHIIK